MGSAPRKRDFFPQNFRNFRKLKKLFTFNRLQNLLPQPPQTSAKQLPHFRISLYFKHLRDPFSQPPQLPQNLRKTSARLPQCFYGCPVLTEHPSRLAFVCPHLRHTIRTGCIAF